MDAEFWHERWEQNRIGFHEGKPNQYLVRNIDKLGPAPASRIFLPLCGKTVDMPWLLAKGYKVVGIELNPKAVEQFFSELGTTPKITDLGALKLYQADNIDIYLGDFFALMAEQLGDVDAIYDRAALVALPEDMRKKYAKHLTEITKTAPQLLITFEYDQTKRNGPPFSIIEREVHAHYESVYALKKLNAKAQKNNLNDGHEIEEMAWYLSPLSI